MNDPQSRKFPTYEAFQAAAIAELEKSPNPDIPAIAELLGVDAFAVWKVAKGANLLPDAKAVKTSEVARTHKATGEEQKQKPGPKPKSKSKLKSKSKSGPKPITEIVSPDDIQKVLNFLDHNSNAIQAAHATGVTHVLVCRIAEENKRPVVAGLRPSYRTPKP